MSKKTIMNGIKAFIIICAINYSLFPLADDLLYTYGINIFGEDTNSWTTIGQGLTVTNEVILQAHAKKRLVCWLMHRHQHVGVNVRTPTSHTLITFRM